MCVYILNKKLLQVNNFISCKQKKQKRLRIIRLRCSKRTHKIIKYRLRKSEIKTKSTSEKLKKVN